MMANQSNGSETAAEPWRFERLRLPNGLNMQVARAGAGPLIVMLHGFPECWYSWRHQIRSLCGSFECVAPDMRGYGGTDAPKGVANYTVEKLVEDVAGLVHVLGRERAMILGHDWGGMVAWATALMRPELVERLCVLNCPHPVRFLSELRSNPRQMLRSWYIVFFQVPYLADAMLRANGAAMVARGIRSTAANKRAFSDEDLAHFRQAFERPYSATAALNYYRALRRRDLMGRLPAEHWMRRRIAAPTLLIWGERDVALGKELTYGMEGLFSGPFEIKYVPDSGHWVQQEQPNVVNQYLRDFLPVN
ncbi:MAG: alpha/beta fold hydrolase [Candidatus Binataceae bacterium]